MEVKASPTEFPFMFSSVIAFLSFCLFRAPNKADQLPLPANLQGSSALPEPYSLSTLKGRMGQLDLGDLSSGPCRKTTGNREGSQKGSEVSSS